MSDRYWLRIIEEADDETGVPPPAQLSRIRIRAEFVDGLPVFDVDLVTALYAAVLTAGSEGQGPVGGPYRYELPAPAPLAGCWLEFR